MEVREEELCVVCEQLRRCVLLVPEVANLNICMVCLADAMLLLAPEIRVPTPEQAAEFQQYLDNRPGG